MTCEAGAAMKVLDMLKGKVSDEKRKAIEHILIGDLGMDEPEAFRGMSKPGGTMTALDGLQPQVRAKVINIIAKSRSDRERGFNERNPGAARIAVL
jgi:hypothetical protein